MSLPAGSRSSSSSFLLRERHIIDIFKGSSLVYILFLIYSYHQMENLTLWIYAALHGSYGLLWVMKSQIFPDKNWERPLTLIRFILLISGLLAYWIAPLIITLHSALPSHELPAIFSPPPSTSPSPFYLFICLFLYIFGIFFHFTADMQKYLQLSLQPNQLITTGLWAYSINPNYFGELLIYTSFSLLSQHWLPFLLFSLIILLEWVPNMIRKVRSLSRYGKSFKEYRAKVGLLFPTGWFKQQFLSTKLQRTD